MDPHTDHRKGVGCEYFQVLFTCTGHKKAEIKTPGLQS